MLRPTVWPWFAIAFAATAAALRSQVAWQLVSTASSPSARAWHAGAAELNGRILVFGGFRVSGFVPNWLDDAWLFDGLVWTQTVSVTRPPVRAGHRLAHDLVRGRTVLFGGNNLSTLDDTWEWDGTSWLAQNPVHRPSARTHFSMAFDLPRFRTVLFGGMGVGSDTWEWDGVDWTQVVTANAPSSRDGAGLAADVARGRLVLFGGYGCGMLNDTWEYDGQNWIQRLPATTPAARTMPGFVYDILRQRTVMFGGGVSGVGNFVETWEWDGIDWRMRQPAGTVPAGRRGVAMAFDWYRHRTVLFGGADSGSGQGLFADTFHYAATSPASYSAYGTGCGGTAGVPALMPLAGRAPWTGDAWGLELALLPNQAPALLVLGTSRTAWGTTSLPLSLASFGLPGCTLLVSPDASLFTVAVAQVATWPIAIPGNQALLGVTMFAQGAGMDRLANAGGLVASNALELTFGGR